MSVALELPAKDEGFPCVADPGARVLVLGSMPGQASLAAAQYYAHPRNAFWEIMGVLFGAGRELPYEARLVRLRSSGIALWDVAHRCRRPGSLDAAIDRDSVEPNDFATLFSACPRLRWIFFNGATAETLYRRLVLSDLPEPGRSMTCRRLPSTSPAHAALDFEAKLKQWRVVQDALAASSGC